MNILKFYQIVSKLKETKRSGWVERGVTDAESVSDHSFMTALLCMTILKKGINREKAIKMALVHDLAESEIGDLITKEHWEQGGTIARSEKAKKEEKAMKEIVSNLSAEEASEIMGLWKDYEDERNPEAIFVRDMDVLEMILQAYSYHKNGNFKKSLDVFWDEENTKLIKDAKIRKLIEDLK
jgi:putative hydrolase of HD superfamily